MKRIAQLLFAYCCICGGKATQVKKLSRREIRERYEALHKKKDVDSDTESERPTSSSKSRREAQAKKENHGATQIQRVVRGFVGRQRAQRQARAIMDAANAFWRDFYQQRLDAERDALLRRIAMRQVVGGFINSVVDFSVQFLLEADDASTTIQRIWRGYRARKNLPPRPSPPPNRPIPRVLRGRHSRETLRRVWARSMFEPTEKGVTYLHKTERGYREYDIWKQIDHPPAGFKHGLRTRKIALPLSVNDRERMVKGETVFAVTDDRQAWLGIGVDMEDMELKEERKRERLARERDRLLFPSSNPYAYRSRSSENPRHPDRSPLTQIFAEIAETHRLWVERELSRINAFSSGNNDLGRSGESGYIPRGSLKYDPSTGRRVRHLGDKVFREVRDETADRFLTQTAQILSRGRAQTQTEKESLPQNALDSQSLSVASGRLPRTQILRSGEIWVSGSGEEVREREREEVFLSQYRPLTSQRKPVAMRERDLSVSSSWSQLKETAAKSISTTSRYSPTTTAVLSSPSSSSPPGALPPFLSLPPPLRHSLALRRATAVAEREKLRRQLLRRERHWRERYSWLPQPLLSAALRAHYYPEYTDYADSRGRSRSQSVERETQREDTQTPILHRESGHLEVGERGFDEETEERDNINNNRHLMTQSSVSPGFMLTQIEETERDTDINRDDVDYDGDRERDKEREREYLRRDKEDREDLLFHRTGHSYETERDLHEYSADSVAEKRSSFESFLASAEIPGTVPPLYLSRDNNNNNNNNRDREKETENAWQVSSSLPAKTSSLLSLSASLSQTGDRTGDRRQRAVDRETHRKFFQRLRVRHPRGGGGEEDDRERKERERGGARRWIGSDAKIFSEELSLSQHSLSQSESLSLSVCLSPSPRDSYRETNRDTDREINRDIDGEIDREINRETGKREKRKKSTRFPHPVPFV